MGRGQAVLGKAPTPPQLPQLLEGQLRAAAAGAFVLLQVYLTLKFSRTKGVPTNWGKNSCLSGCHQIWMVHRGNRFVECLLSARRCARCWECKIGHISALIYPLHPQASEEQSLKESHQLSTVAVILRTVKFAWGLL